MIAHNKEEHTNSLAAYMPNGPLFEAKNIADSNFRQLLKGFAGELFTAEGYLITLEQEYFPDTTNLFLSEWESALGIPDDCFSGTGTNNERRRDILAKLSSLGIQTDTDFVALAALFGVTIEVNSGSVFSIFPLTFPVLLFSTKSDARFTIVVDFIDQEVNEFPLIFPFIFGSEILGTLECLFNKLKPENCNVIFRQV